MKRRIRLAIADDAHFMREGLRRLLRAEARIELVGTAANGEELIARLDEWQPDVVTLDLDMPGMGGLNTLDRVLAWRPIPVIILSARSANGAPITIEALNRGAVDFIDKSAYSLVDFEALRSIIVSKILHVTHSTDDVAPVVRSVKPAIPVVSSGVELVVIGASTGGPRAIESVLDSIRDGLPVPIVIVQHMPIGFTGAFAARLDRVLPMHVCEARDGQVLVPGMAAIAPAGKHLMVVRNGDGLVVALESDGRSSLHVPSVDVLFESAALCCGGNVAAVLLTGMGADGAQGMLTLANLGAHTIAQDEATSVVYGMPRAAVLRGGARESLPLHRIGERVRELCVQLTGA